jgi:RNA polymerase sigma-70 factor (ECF subfamily)
MKPLNSPLQISQLEAIYRQRVGEFRRLALAIVHNYTVAEDVVQDAFASAVRNRAEFKGESSVATWVWRIVVNKAISQDRDQRWRLDEPTTELMFEDVHERTSSDGADVVRKALAELPERQRLVVFLHYYADLDYRDIGDVLGISQGTVGATLHSARRSLRQALLQPKISSTEEVQP